MAESNNIIPQASSVTSPTGVIVPLYFSPDGTWDIVAQAKKDHPSVPIVAIINPNNGTGSSKDPGIASGVQNLQSAGVLVIGYVATLDGSVNSTTVDAAIDTYKSWYNVSGVFLDEMSNTAGNETYYSNIHNYAISQGLTLTVGNPGQATVSSYVGTVDNIVIYEDGGMPSNSTLATNTFNGASPKSNFSYVAFGVSPIPSNSTILGTTAYVGYMYITDDNLPDPYNTLSSHFGNLVAALDTTPPPPPPQTVPSAPQNLQATPGNAQVSISWQVPSSNGGSPITNYNVYRGTSSGSETLLTQIGNLTSYTDGTATNGQTYYYKVSAVNSAGESTLSNEASATPTPPPPPPQTAPSAPQNPQATGGNAKVTLNWQAPSSNGGSAITYYKIYKTTSSGTEVYLTKRGNVTSYTDLAVTNGLTYFYKVSALNSVGESPQSNEAIATLPAVPTAPQNLQATPGVAKILLNWQVPSSNGGSAITNYKIYRSTSTGTETLLTTRGNLTSYTDTTVDKKIE